MRLQNQKLVTNFVLLAAALSPLGCSSASRSSSTADRELEAPGVEVNDPPEVASPKRDFEHPMLSPCESGDMEACNLVGVALLEGDGVPQDGKAGVGFLDRSCSGKSAAGCFNRGVVNLEGEHEPNDDKKALGFFEHACALNHAKGCLQAGFMHSTGKGTDVDGKVALTHFEKGCTLGDTTSCRNTGILLAQGKVVPKNTSRAATYFGKACKAGDEESCTLEEEVAGPTTPTVAGANLTMGELSADGFTARDVSCRADGLGFLGGVLIVAGLAKRKSQFDRCAPNGAEPSVRWKFANNGVSSVTATGASPTVNACVERTMKTVNMAGSGECVATIPIGQR